MLERLPYLVPNKLSLQNTAGAITSGVEADARLQNIKSVHDGVALAVCGEALSPLVVGVVARPPTSVFFWHGKLRHTEVYTSTLLSRYVTEISCVLQRTARLAAGYQV